MRGCAALPFVLKSAHPRTIQAAPYGMGSPAQNSRFQAAPVTKTNRKPNGTAWVSSSPPNSPAHALHRVGFEYLIRRVRLLTGRELCVDGLRRFAAGLSNANVAPKARTRAPPRPWNP